MKSIVLVLAALLACATTKTLTITADPSGSYHALPKHFDAESKQAIVMLYLACAQETGNEMACICATWNLSERYSVEDLGKMEDTGLSIWTDLLAQCMAKHPLPAAAEPSEATAPGGAI